ncbi:MAG: methyltransferase domain-containing protein [Gammaproteobacteria bacterium]|nr:methyltransferase domain-containing protein [Gammaproteobacteria bacterium]
MTEAKKESQAADSRVDDLYASVREAYGDKNPKANGYRLHQYFLKEQALVLSEIPTAAETIIDIACGSGLFIQPADSDTRTVLGIDYNEQACLAADKNGLIVLRGNAFSLPLADECCDVTINCQFLNQQSAEQAKLLLDEMYRILKPGGRLIIIWRNDRAWIHKLAVFILRYYDRMIGRPDFPHYDNYIVDLMTYCREKGFSLVKTQLCFPLLNLKFDNFDSPAAKVLGASCFMVLDKT